MNKMQVFAKVLRLFSELAWFLFLKYFLMAMRDIIK